MSKKAEIIRLSLDGLRPIEIARTLGASVSYIEKVRRMVGDMPRARGKSYTDADRTEVLAVFHEQPWLFNSQIARLTGVHVSTVSSLLRSERKAMFGAATPYKVGLQSLCT